MGICCSDDGPKMNPSQVDLTHFIIHRVLGKGGFGKVSCVEHRPTTTFYALKSIEKALLIAKDTVTNDNVRATWLERDIMSRFRSNFLVHLEYAFQDEFYLYMVMSFMRGGDLRYHLGENRNVIMAEESVRFYIAEILLGLEEMHSLHIVYRDLKPENCLLDSDGHVRLSDFGLCGRLDLEANGKTWGQCGTNGFMAPEMLAGFEYDTSVDIYSLGVVMYELLHDRLPDMSQGTAHLFMRNDLSDEAQDLLMGLLEVLPEQRLGCTTEYRLEEIKMHPWFKGIDWEAASRKELKPPFIPNSNIANCDPSYELEEQLLDTPVPRRITLAQDGQFVGWEFHVDLSGTASSVRAALENCSPNTAETRRLQSVAAANSSQQTELHYIRRSSGTLVHLINGKSLKEEQRLAVKEAEQRQIQMQTQLQQQQQLQEHLEQTSRNHSDPHTYHRDDERERALPSSTPIMPSSSSSSSVPPRQTAYHIDSRPQVGVALQLEDAEIVEMNEDQLLDGRAITSDDLHDVDDDD